MITAPLGRCRNRRPEGRRRQFAAARAQGRRARRRAAGRRRRQGLAVRVAAGGAGEWQPRRTTPLVAGLAGDRVGQIQIRLTALSGPRIRHRQRRVPGWPTPGSTSCDGNSTLGSRPRSENAASMNGCANWPGSEIHQRCLEERSRPQHLAERHRVPAKQIQGPLQFLLTVVQDGQHTVQLVDGRLQLCSVVARRGPISGVTPR